MKALKIVLFVVLGIVALLVIVNAVMPAKMVVERSRTIQAPVEVLFDQVNRLSAWENWSPWHQIDTAMVITYAGPESGNGASYSWESNNPDVGRGKLTILSSAANDSIFMEMDFMENGKATGLFHFQPTDSGTVVRWGMESEMPFMMRFMSLFFSGYIEKDFDKGLAALEDAAKAAPAANFEIMETSFPGWNTLTIRVKCDMNSISQKLGESYGRIMEYMAKSGLKQASSPFAIYYSWEENAFEFDAGIPVDKPGKASGDIQVGTIPRGRVLVSKYYGPYEGTGAAHEQLQKFAGEKGIQIDMAPWEVYVTDPGTEPDPKKWLTEIYYRVK